MKRSLLLLFLSFLSTSTIGFGQSSEITFEFIGNCGLHLTDGSTDLYIDFPYKSGAFNYMEFDESELDSIKENSYFVFTHKHADHYSRKSLRSTLKKKKGAAFGVWNISKLAQLQDSFGDFEIEAFKTKHSFFGIPFRHYSYLITWHGIRIFLSGDTTNPETIGTIEDIDWAFVPYWILKSAREQEINIDASMSFVYHLYPSQIKSAEEAFAEKETIHPLTVQGEKHSISFSKP